MTNPTTAILHYSAPPVIGGVEGVIQAHCDVFHQHDYPVAVIAGRGEKGALPGITAFHSLPEVDSQHPDVLEISAALEDGKIPEHFEAFTEKLVQTLTPIVAEYDNLIVHNVFTKHFNLPLTAALFRLIRQDAVRNCIAWCHDFTWTSPSSGSKVHDGYPWDLLRKYDPRITYVTVSQERQKTLADLYGQPEQDVKVIYNGVDARTLLGLTQEGHDLITRLNLLAAELILLMPVRVTQAKNIEYALDFVSGLRSRGIEPKLVLTGPPDPHSDESMAYFKSLQKRRHELGLDDAMHFVFESGPDPGQTYEIGLDVVGDLYRVSDVMLMPSHREGFGMPVLEAGLVGIPAICTPNVPAAIEIGGEDVTIFEATGDPSGLVEQLCKWMAASPQYRFRRRVRRKYTWTALFEGQIQPLLEHRP